MVIRPDELDWSANVFHHLHKPTKHYFHGSPTFTAEQRKENPAGERSGRKSSDFAISLTAVANACETQTGFKDADVVYGH